MIIGAAWIKKGKDDKNYLSCQIEVPGMEISFALFKNDKKEKENQPDYHVVWSKKRQQTETPNQPDTSVNSLHFDDSEIPF